MLEIKALNYSYLWSICANFENKLWDSQIMNQSSRLYSLDHVDKVMYKDEDTSCVDW